MTERGRAGLLELKALSFLFLLLQLLPNLAGQESGLPRIQKLNNQDTAFVQYISDVESARRLLYTSGSGADTFKNISEILTIYSYTVGSDENILTLSARCNIPYSSLATINRISNFADFSTGDSLLLPSVPGLFIPEKPENELELLLYSSRADEEGIMITVSSGQTKTRFLFLPGQDFNATERIFFLNRGFTYPLKNFVISSTFGPRKNPVTGVQGIHQGLDLAAPEGTPVYAAREGKVSEVGKDAVLGNYIIISHGENWVSLYGHLSKIETVLNQQVNSGSLIGRVGTTGQSTGPHLHFELRQNGKPQNPEGLLRLFQGN
ncbi:MAG: M23 family metallopeptidase [Treponema sp.]|nr:M23 family metallopeptidase [Treponema sp.]